MHQSNPLQHPLKNHRECLFTYPTTNGLQNHIEKGTETYINTVRAIGILR